MRVVKNSLESARYYLKQEQKRLISDIDREFTALAQSQTTIDKARHRLDEIDFELADVEAAASTLDIKLDDVI